MGDRFLWPGGLWDEPGTYEPLETWEAYLRMVETMECTADAIPSKSSLLRSAREVIRFKKVFKRKHGRDRHS